MSALPKVEGYVLERRLGAGAHGEVFLAREEAGLRRLVALKVFAPEQRASFERELEAAAQVEELRRRERVPGLVQALGSGEREGHAWLALEYLEKGSLADRVAGSGPLAAEDAVPLVREAAAALILLHRAGLFHRDVKPANLLVGSDGRVRLGDFGLVRPLDGTLSAAGSPAFAAPELIASKPVSGVLADVYSLGATLAFLLTGETMLPGRPDMFAFERRGVPRPLQRAIVDATAADPSERTASLEAFMAALVERNLEAGRGNPAASDDASGGDVMRLRLLETRLLEAKSEPRLSRSAVVAFVASLLTYPIAIPGAVLHVELKSDAAEVISAALQLACIALGVGLGILARRRIRRVPGALRGSGLALAGIIIASLELALALSLTAAMVYARSRPHG
jgi:serine/threonine-protein kinase